MRIHNLLHDNSRLAFAVAFAVLLALPACSVNVKKDDDGKDKNVDIQTPVGGIHVSEDADSRDIGLPVYPGAREKQKEEGGDSKNANVHISSGFFGVKVVAIEFEADDPPQKIIAYYKDQLKKYGSVIECHTNRLGGVVVNDIHNSKEVTCSGDKSGDTVELKVGTEDNQHVVSVQPEGKGSGFSLVYIKIRGKDTI